MVAVDIECWPQKCVQGSVCVRRVPFSRGGEGKAGWRTALGVRLWRLWSGYGVSSKVMECLAGLWG